VGFCAPDRDEVRLLNDELREWHGEAFGVPVDMAASENVETFMETVVQRLAVQSYSSTTRAPRALRTSSDDRY
jgi:hypothetical protein